ncbi:MAG: hypothetical protein ACF8TS_16830, partial [Maioricimonas sp. JB049]
TARRWQQSGPSRLNQLGVPAGVADWMRRVRRFWAGPAVPAGGEEWPLYYHHHAPEVLAEIRRALQQFDTPEQPRSTVPACRSAVTIAAG